MKRTRDQEWEDMVYGELRPLMDTDQPYWIKLFEELNIVYPRCGVRVGEGWKTIINELIHKLIDMGWDKDLAQVKEKFGGLRFYIGKATPEMYEVVHEVENKTRTMCEACGQPGKIGDYGGSRVFLCFCETHGKMYANRKNYIRPGYDK